MKQLARCCLVVVVTSLCVGMAACGQELATITAPSQHAQALIGGVPTAPHEYPAVGALLTQFPDGRLENQLCTATLIAPDLVLTASHCAPTEPTDLLLFSLKRNVRANLGRKPPRDAVPIDYFLAHEQLNDGFRLLHDVAVGHLARPIEGVPPYALLAPQDAGTITLDTTLDLVGYGYFHYLAQGDSSAFHGVKLKGTASVRALEPWLIGVGDEEGEVQGCFGDSGGPALVATANGLRIAGVVSAQRIDPWVEVPRPCTGGTWYTSVADHAAWIHGAIARMP